MSNSHGLTDGVSIGSLLELWLDPPLSPAGGDIPTRWDYSHYTGEKDEVQKKVSITDKLW